MEGLLTLLGPLGSPVSFIGLILFMYAYLRKQEAQVNADLKQTIDRQKVEIESLVKDNSELDAKLREYKRPVCFVTIVLAGCVLQIRSGERI